MFETLIGKKNFSLDRLATLCQVADSGSIGAAAGDNPNQQSQYSRQISELSQFLGVPLLDKHTKPHRLTKEGEELGRISRIYLSALEDFIGGCQNQPAKIVVGAGESLILWLLIPGVLPKLRQGLPRNTKVIFRNLQSEPIIDAIQNGEIDLGFVRKDAVPKSLETAGDFRLGYHLFVPKRFRPKFKSPVTLNQLANLPMAALEGSGQFRTMLDRLATDAKVNLEIVTECSSATQMALLVARKECCAILPSFARSQLNKESVDDFPVEGLESLERTLCFTWNPKRATIRPIVEQAAQICARA